MGCYRLYLPGQAKSIGPKDSTKKLSLVGKLPFNSSGEMQPISCFQLLKDPTNMDFDRSLGNTEVSGDFSIAYTL